MEIHDIYSIPKEIKSEIKLKWGFFLKDIIVVVGMLGWGWGTKSFFEHEINPFFYILVNGIFGIFLILKPYNNPQKRNYQLLGLVFKQDKKKYKSF